MRKTPFSCFIGAMVALLVLPGCGDDGAAGGGAAGGGAGASSGGGGTSSGGGGSGGTTTGGAGGADAGSGGMDSGTGGANPGGGTGGSIPTTNLCESQVYANPSAGAVGHTTIAHWKYGRSAALTINFDDSTPGQAQLGVPAMIARGLTGTWFVNPGQPSFQAESNTWLVQAPNNGQELANHSMDHAGAKDLADADYQIGEAAKTIWAAYPPERSKLIAFNNGGGTNWNISDAQYAQLLDTYFCIERKYSSGVAPATPGNTIYQDVKTHLSTGGWADDWGNIHFHGICNPTDTVNCVCDTPSSTANCREYGNGVNNGAVSLDDFTQFLDHLVTDSYFANDVWIAGFIQAYKYQQSRNAAKPSLASATGSELVLCLQSTLDPKLYDEELTLHTRVPSGWSSCTVGQAGKCQITDGVATFEAPHDRGDIHLTGN